LSELLTYDLHGPAARSISILVATILVVFLSIYTSAQWLAGEKFLGGVLAITPATALLGFGAVIVAYSAIGGFRGSVYVDTLQAVIRLGGTAVALAVVIGHARSDPAAFSRNIAGAGPGFLDPLANGSVIGSVAFMLGFAGAAIGFGLGQPQIVSRYMAGENPAETRAAWWIYIGFLQSTWISMTVFGIVLRGVQPGIADPETGLSLFFQTSVGAVATGIIFADVFATIASTANGLLIAISQAVRRDILGGLLGERQYSLVAMTAFTLAIGLATIGLSFVLPGNVFSLAIAAVSQIGAGLAGAVMIKVFGWRHSAFSLLLTIVVGAMSGAVWHLTGLGATINEAPVGIILSLATNFLIRPPRPR
jgi:Na+/proline symporter